MTKKRNPIAFWYKLSKGLAIVAIVFYLLENLFFTLIHGWHWKAVTDLEMWADMVYQVLAGGAIISLLIAVSELLEDRVKQDAKWTAFSAKMEKAAREAVLEGLRDEDLTPIVPYTGTEPTFIVPCNKDCGLDYCGPENGCLHSRILNRRKSENE